MKAAANLVIIAGCLALASSQGVPQQSNSFATSVAYVSAGARGFIQGYRQGMYKDTNYKVSDACFGAETQQYLVNTFSLWGTPKFDWQQQAVEVGACVSLITNNCDYDESIYDYLTYCYQTEACEIPNMFQTLLKKIFQVTTVGNEIAALVMQGLPAQTAKAETIQEYFAGFGLNGGKILRYATDFDPTQIQLA